MKWARRRRRAIIHLFLLHYIYREVQKQNADDGWGAR